MISENQNFGDGHRIGQSKLTLLLLSAIKEGQESRNKKNNKYRQRLTVKIAVISTVMRDEVA